MRNWNNHKKELDEKIKGALIKPKEAQNIGEDTISPPPPILKENE